MAQDWLILYLRIFSERSKRFRLLWDFQENLKIGERNTRKFILCMGK